jgi:hypothetical protein
VAAAAECKFTVAEIDTSRITRSSLRQRNIFVPVDYVRGSLLVSKWRCDSHVQWQIYLKRYSSCGRKSDMYIINFYTNTGSDRLCGLVVRVAGYRSRGPGFDSQHYQIFWEVVGLEWGRLSLVRITEELLEWKSSSSRSRKTEFNGHGDPLRWLRDTLYPQKLTLTSQTSGGRLVCIVRSWTKATEFFFTNTGSAMWGSL